MWRNSEAEISVRHFPDLSDTSISPQNPVDGSFQIPAYHDGAPIRDMELDFDAFDEDQLGGLEADPFTTPLHHPKTRSHPPLTLSELTPKAERKPVDNSGSNKALDKLDRETEKLPSEFVRRVLPEKDSVDDMFARRKRDNYQQMGIDLSSKSTARYRYSNGGNTKADANIENNYAPTDIITEKSEPKPNGNIDVAMVARLKGVPSVPPSNPLAKERLKPKEKNHVINKDTGVAKYRPHAGLSKHGLQPKVKSILKPSHSKPSSTLPASTLTRTIVKASNESQEERPRWGDVVAEIRQTGQRRESSGSSIAALGGGLIDVLVMYGEKLKGSLGFSSSGSRSSLAQVTSTINDTKSTPSSSSRSPHNLVEMFDEPMLDATIPSSNSKPLTLSDLTPSRSDQPKPDVLTLSDLSPSKHRRLVDTEDETATLSPMRLSKKRISTGSSGRHKKKGKCDENIEPPPSSETSRGDHAPTKPKRRSGTALASKVREGIASRVREGITVKPKEGISKKMISRPKPLAPSYVLNKEPKRDRHQRDAKSGPAGGVPASNSQSRSDQAKITVATLEQRGNDDGKQSLLPTNQVTIAGPTFVRDIYRQLSLERKGSVNETGKNKEAKSSSYFTKPAPPARPAARPTVPAIRPASTLPPTRPTSTLSVTRTHGTVSTLRPTVPAAFTFQSHARAAQRNVEFEEKRKTWESRATRAALPIPDFAAMHAAQAEAEAARSKRVIPITSEGPMLTTMIRAREREKFESERRERERLLEMAREQKERERAEQEEREYREARRRAVPKAHEVPDWYRTMPKKKGDIEEDEGR